MKGFTPKWYLKHTGIQMAAPKKRQKRSQSPLEAKFESIWVREFNPESPYLFPLRKEYRFHPKRRYRFDFAWPDMKVALELDGGLFLKRGGHTSCSGKTRDCEKDFLAIQNGWYVIRWTAAMITTENCYKLRDVLLGLTF